MNRVHAYGYCVGDETWSFNIVYTEIIRAMIRNGYSMSIQFGTPEFQAFLRKIPPYKKEKGWAFSCGCPDTLEIMPMERRSYYCYWGEHRIRPDHASKMNSLDIVFVNSEFSKRLLQESGVKTRIETMHPGFNPRLHYPAERSYSEGVRKFLFVGQQWRRKGLDSLAEAWEPFFTNESMMLTLKLSPTNPNDLPKVQNLFGKARNVNIIYDGLPKERLADLYRCHDVFLFPSRSEGFGIPVLEAMACGLLPIVTNFGGYLDFCNPSNALLVPFKGLIPRDDGMDTGEWANVDSSALYEAIKGSLTMDIDAGKRQRARSVAYYTYDITVQNMKKLFL